MFWYIFDGEAIANDGKLQLDDHLPGVGLTLKPHPEHFTIIE